MIKGRTVNVLAAATAAPPLRFMISGFCGDQISTTVASFKKRLLFSFLQLERQ